MSCANGEEWEISNDEGFIYDRKRLRVGLTVSIAGLPLAVQISDPKVKEKVLRDRRTKMLCKLNARYQREIEKQGIFSRSLNSRIGREDNVQELQNEWERDETRGNFNKDVAFGYLMDEQLFQIEVHEAAIYSDSNLRNHADELPEVEEEQMKHHLINLPIWDSPHELMASLCGD